MARTSLKDLFTLLISALGQRRNDTGRFEFQLNNFSLDGASQALRPTVPI